MNSIKESLDSFKKSHLQALNAQLNLLISKERGAESSVASQIVPAVSEGSAVDLGHKKVEVVVVSTISIQDPNASSDSDIYSDRHTEAKIKAIQKQKNNVIVQASIKPF